MNAFSKKNIFFIYFFCFLIPTNIIAAEQPNRIEMFDQLIHASEGILELSGCELNDNELCELSQKLLYNKSIFCLSLAANRISDKGFKVLVNVLPFTAIQSCFMHSNNISDNGIEHFCKSPSVQNELLPLTLLDIRNNQITEAGYRYIPQLMAITKKIKVCVHYDQESHFLKKSLKSTLSTQQLNATVHGLFSIIANRRIDDETCATFIQRLVQQGANINATCSKKNKQITPLYLAVSLGNHRSETIKALCQAGADLHVQSSNGKTPIDKACKTNDESILEFLLKYAEQK